jgi:hypothetical protein
MFHVGQKVICIRSFSAREGFGIEIVPLVGVVYTVRFIENHRDDPRLACGQMLLLVEIVNQPFEYLAGFVECIFSGDCFRPFVTTDISVFEPMLEPVPTNLVPA